jgi:hypothetical protein
LVNLEIVGLATNDPKRCEQASVTLCEAASSKFWVKGFTKAQQSHDQCHSYMTKIAIYDGSASDGLHSQIFPRFAHKEIPILTFCNKQALENTISS